MLGYADIINLQLLQVEAVQKFNKKDRIHNYKKNNFHIVLMFL